MFTGIIRCLGILAALRPQGDGMALEVKAEGALARMASGDSLAVDGICLTLESRRTRRLRFHAVRETLSRTTLRSRRAGDRVNLEPALRAGDPLGGHFVQGHVDGVGEVVGISRERRGRRVRVRLPKPLRRGVVEKGSIALDGISLTVAAVKGDTIEVALVPFTLTHTTAGGLAAGRRVNVELDVLGKYARARPVLPNRKRGAEVRSAPLQGRPRSVPPA